MVVSRRWQSTRCPVQGRMGYTEPTTVLEHLQGTCTNYVLIRAALIKYVMCMHACKFEHVFDVWGCFSIKVFAKPLVPLNIELRPTRNQSGVWSSNKWSWPRNIFLAHSEHMHWWSWKNNLHLFHSLSLSDTECQEARKTILLIPGLPVLISSCVFALVHMRITYHMIRMISGSCRACCRANNYSRSCTVEHDSWKGLYSCLLSCDKSMGSSTRVGRQTFSSDQPAMV